MRPHYDPVGQAVPNEELHFDHDQVLWHGSERFTGFTAETLSGGDHGFQSYRDGWLEGPSGTVTSDGDLLTEQWFRGNHLYGIARTFRRDGTLAKAVGYEYGYDIWTVTFDFDGSTVLSTVRGEFDEWDLKALRSMRLDAPMPPLPGPEDAADLSKH